MRVAELNALSENKLFYPALDGIRAVAILMVFYHHYLNFHPTVFSSGWAGVDVFFVLSGFLITGILYDTRNARDKYRIFYIRRSLRIFPLYYAVLLVALCLNPVFHWIWHPAWLLWPCYLGNYAQFIWLPDYLNHVGTMLQLRSSLPFTSPFFLSVNHFWSLCVEEQFYLIWPIVVFSIKDRVKLRNVCLAIVVISLIARIVCLYLVPAAYLKAELLYRFTPLRSDSLLLGGVIALMLRGPEMKKLQQAAWPIFYSLITGLLLFQAGYFLIEHHWYDPSANLWSLETIGYSLIDLFAGVIILLSLDPRTWFYKFFIWKPLRQLGKLSYGFYIFHDLFHDVYSRLTFYLFGSFRHDGYVQALVAFVSTLVVAYLSYRFFESPFIRLKDRFAT